MMKNMVAAAALGLALINPPGYRAPKGLPTDIRRTFDPVEGPTLVQVAPVSELPDHVCIPQFRRSRQQRLAARRRGGRS